MARGRGWLVGWLVVNLWRVETGDPSEALKSIENHKGMFKTRWALDPVTNGVMGPQ